MLYRKFEDASSDRFIKVWDLSVILISLLDLRGANPTLRNEEEILERIVEKHTDHEEVSLYLPIASSNFKGNLSDLLSDIFENVEHINKAAEKATKYYSSIRREYGL